MNATVAQCLSNRKAEFLALWPVSDDIAPTPTKAVVNKQSC
jgi:hypothetical protein